MCVPRVKSVKLRLSKGLSSLRRSLEPGPQYPPQHRNSRTTTKNVTEAVTATAIATEFLLLLLLCCPEAAAPLEFEEPGLVEEFSLFEGGTNGAAGESGTGVGGEKKKTGPGLGLGDPNAGPGAGASAPRRV